MSDTALSRAELVVKTIAQTAVDNETYFCELDAVVGDGDFGYSLARGFEIVLSDWDELGYDDAGGLLKKTALVLTKRIGGTSGPIWGTAFLRAGSDVCRQPRAQRATTSSPPCAPRSRGSSSAATPTSATRRCSTRSSPPSTSSRRRSQEGAPDALQRAAATAQGDRRGHQGDARPARAGVSYTGERSRDSVDAGAIGIAVMLEAVSKAWQETELERA